MSRGLPLHRAALACGAILVAAGCAHPAREGLTAEEQRAESARHERAAAGEEQRYDPEAAPLAEPRGPFAGLGPAEGSTSSVALENPTVHHLRAADAHLREAGEHAAAAKELEAAEERACGGLSSAERGACPLWAAAVRASTETDRGVRLSLKPGANGSSLAAGMRCHLAHGRVHGWEGGCPLAVAGAEVVLVDAGTLEIRGDSPRSVAAVQAEARRLFGPR